MLPAVPDVRVIDPVLAFEAIMFPVTLSEPGVVKLTLLTPVTAPFVLILPAAFTAIVVFAFKFPFKVTVFDATPV